MDCIAVDDGCRIAWQMDGPDTAPVVILAHSLASSSIMWQPQVEAFSDRYRILRYDSRGHGRSDAPEGPYTMERLGRDVLALADALKIERFSFCGLSMGGMVGQWLGANAGDRIVRLALCNTAAYMGPPESWQSRIDTARDAGMAALVEATLERWFTPEFRASDPLAVETIRRQYIATDPRGFIGCASAIQTMDQRDLLPRIAVPTLVVAGQADPSTPPAVAEDMHRAISRSRLVVLEAAHLSNIEAATEFNAALDTFLSSAA